MAFVKIFPVMLFIVAGAEAGGFIPDSPERWSIAGVCGLAAILLWRKLESVEKARAKAHEEQLAMMSQHNDKLMDVFQTSIESQHKMTDAINGLTDEFAARPCACEEVKDALKSEARNFLNGFGNRVEKESKK